MTDSRTDARYAHFTPEMHKMMDQSKEELADFKDWADDREGRLLRKAVDECVKSGREEIEVETLMFGYLAKSLMEVFGAKEMRVWVKMIETGLKKEKGKKKIADYSQEEVKTGQLVLDMKARIAHPDGSFDSKKRWQPDVETDSSQYIREPSAAFPFSKMTHCRTSKYQAQLAGLELKRVNEVIKILKEN